MTAFTKWAHASQVFWRDGEPECHRGLAEVGQDAEGLRQRLEERLTQLRDEFAFVAECDAGGDFMAVASVGRLRGIADQSWTCHLDDRLGLPQDDLAREAMDRRPCCSPKSDCLRTSPGTSCTVTRPATRSATTIWVCAC